MSNEIADTGDILDRTGEGDIRENMVATHEPTDHKIQFHVSMRGWTQDDMEALIVEAAARIIVGRTGDNKLAKEIEAKCAELVTRRADAALAKVATDILDQPMIPSFGAKEPVTMREYLGLYGREYLETKVDRGGWNNKTTRIVQIVSDLMDAKFKTEIERSTNAAVTEIKNEVRARHDAIIEAEKLRLREALAKVTA